MSEMESYHSYSPAEGRRSRQSDLSSHSSNERDRHHREEPSRATKMSAMASPFRVPEDPQGPGAPLEPGGPTHPEDNPGVRTTPKILLRPSQEDEELYGANTSMVSFQKGDSVGLRLAGGNDVGIFIAGVQEGSPAEEEGLRTGDQIMKVNNVDFRGIVREEAVLFLLEIPKGESITILALSKPQVYKDILASGRGDSFFIRTHFEYEKEGPQGLAFSRGDIFKVVDTLYDGKLGNWLAVKTAKNKQLQEKGLIPNKSRADQLASVQNCHKVAPGDRADFWRLRGQRAAKRKDARKNRDDVGTVPLATRFPAYERVVLREAGFRRPVVLFGPIADAANEKLASEMPDQFVIAKTEPKDAGSEKSSGVVRLNTIRQIIEQDKHALLDVTPKAVDTLNYTQWYPIVIFFNPDSKQGVKALRHRVIPGSNRSARKLYEQAVKLRKTCAHLFTATIELNSSNDGWYGSVKDSIREQQTQAVWVSDGKLEGSECELECEGQEVDRVSFLSAMSSDYLSLDSRLLASDQDDTADEGGAYTDGEADGAGAEPLEQRMLLAHVSAISRSSEPVTAQQILRRCSPDLHMRRVTSGEANPTQPVFLTDTPKVKPIDPNYHPAHHHPHHQPPPAGGRSYDSPSSSSPASSSNDTPAAAAPLPPPHNHHHHHHHPARSSSPLPLPPPPHHLLNSFGKTQSLAPPAGRTQPDVAPVAPVAATTPTAAPVAPSLLAPPPGTAASSGQGSPVEDPSARSFLGKIKAFEKMDHLARAHRILELQEAQTARLEIAQKHPDIYAVPHKTPKLDNSRPQPIGSSSHQEPHARHLPKVPYSEGRPFYSSAVESEAFYSPKLDQYQDTEL